MAKVRNRYANMAASLAEAADTDTDTTVMDTPPDGPAEEVGIAELVTIMNTGTENGTLTEEDMEDLQAMLLRKQADQEQAQLPATEKTPKTKSATKAPKKTAAEKRVKQDAIVGPDGEVYIRFAVAADRIGVRFQQIYQRAVMHKKLRWTEANGIKYAHEEDIMDWLETRLAKPKPGGRVTQTVNPVSEVTPTEEFEDEAPYDTEEVPELGQ
jgi:hypothetical protein